MLPDIDNKFDEIWTKRGQPFYQKLLNVGITKIKNGSLHDININFSIGFNHFDIVHRMVTPMTPTVKRFYRKAVIKTDTVQR